MPLDIFTQIYEKKDNVKCIPFQIIRKSHNFAE